MNCECLPGCPFFNGRMVNMPTTSELLKEQFCRGDFKACARCMIVDAMGREAVPDDLFPHEVERAREILSSGRDSAGTMPKA